MRLTILLRSRFPIEAHSVHRRLRGAHFTTGCQLAQYFRSVTHHWTVISVAHRFGESRVSGEGRSMFMRKTVSFDDRFSSRGSVIPINFFMTIRSQFNTAETGIKT